MGRASSPYQQGREQDRMFVGIDVSKDRLDVHIRPTGEVFAVARDGAGLEQLVGKLRTIAPSLIVLEATGGFETVVAAALAAAGLPLAVVNPRQIRAFAKACGQLAKTDKLDAAVIAHFADAVQPPARGVPDEAARALAELLTRRRQLIGMMTAERNPAAPGADGGPGPGDVAVAALRHRYRHRHGDPRHAGLAREGGTAHHRSSDRRKDRPHLDR
jgi:transposase